MTLLERYLNYLSQICEGSRKAPDGIMLTKTGDMEKAIELQQQIAAIGIPEFVRLCAAQDGETIPEEELESFDPSQMLAALSNLETSQEGAEEQPQEEVPEEPEAPVKSEIRDIYEVFLDSVCLEDNLLSYLIDIAKRGAKDEFQTLSHAAARTLLSLDEFLLWLGNKEALAGPDERACAAIMDAALNVVSCRRGKESLPRHCSPAMRRRSSFSGPKRRSLCIYRTRRTNGTCRTISTATIPCGLL